MDPILIEFERDLEKVKRLLNMLQYVRAFAGTNRPPYTASDDFLAAATNIYDQSRSSHADLPVLTGTLVLYLGGRFESYVRTIFEDLCIRIVDRATSFSDLPKIMRKSLIKYTAEVMANPPKFGHGDQGVKSFISTLASNLDDSQEFKQTNVACLSITYGNMRENTITELFDRIGAKDLWLRIGQQAAVMQFFGTSDSEQAKNKATTYLNTFMNTRNQIAHPSLNITWPDATKVMEYVEFFHTLGKAIAELIPIYEIDLS